MSNGSYDRQAPSAASQIITLERLLEESEERNTELGAEKAKLREALEIIAGKRQCVDSTMSNVDVARAALLTTTGDK